MSSVVLKQNTVTPPRPKANGLRLYFNDDGDLCSIDSSGNIRVYGEGGISGGGNFSYNVVSDTVVVPAGQQMRVYQDLTIRGGDLYVYGEVIIKDI